MIMPNQIKKKGGNKGSFDVNIVIRNIIKNNKPKIQQPKIHHKKNITDNEKTHIAEFLRQIANITYPPKTMVKSTNMIPTEIISHQLRSDGMKFKTKWYNKIDNNDIKITNETITTITQHSDILQTYLDKLKATKPKSHNCLLDKFPLELGHF